MPDKDGAQAPPPAQSREPGWQQSAGDDGAQAPPPARLARAATSQYRRNLPHMQTEGATFFITFTTLRRWILPEPARDIVLEHVVHDHGARYQLHAAVIMPDHVHVLLTPDRDARGNTFGLAEIMQGMKGASAHHINRALHRRGPVWQPESFDTSLRKDEKTREKAEYICANPVRAGLVSHEDAWPWLWREWIEGASPDQTRQSNNDRRRRPRLRSIPAGPIS